MLLRAVRNARLRSAAVRTGFYITSAVFTVVGFVFSLALWVGFLMPQAEQGAARNWIRIPCTVVQSSASGAHDSYVTVFAYAYHGTEYRSDRANFYTTSTNSRYSAGSQLTGWIDPARPERFVQDLHYTPRWYFVLLLFVAATVPFAAVVRIIHGMATLSPSLLRYLGEKPDSLPARG